MVAQDTAKVLEEANDVISDTIDILEDRASWLVRNPKAVVLSATLAGVSIGLVAGYLVAGKRLETKYEKLANEEIQSVKEHYALVYKDGFDLNEMASRYEEMPADLGYTGETPKTVVRTEVAVVREEVAAEDQVEEITTATVIESNIFASEDPDTFFNYEEEMERRKAFPNSPHVITLDEFNQNDPDHEQSTLTYFDGDGVLVDEREQPIPDEDSIVGSENMLRFGHGSNDPNVVYIRNARLKTDFEVLHSDGKYTREVLGVLEHSDTSGLRKFRDRD